MKWIAAGTLGLLMLTAPASAWPFHGAALVTCPQGVHANDGCPAADGLFRVANLFTNATYTQQTYAARPPQNVPFVDFGIGYSVLPVLDPKVLVPTGCAWSDTGSAASGPLLTCTTGAVSIVGYELGAIGGHQATVIDVKPTVTSFTMTNNHWLNDANTVSGYTAGNSFALFLESISTYPVTITKNVFDGACTSSACALNNFHFGIFSGGAVDIERNVYENFPTRQDAGCNDTSVGCGTTQGNWTFQYNALIGFGYNGFVHHEWVLMIMNQIAQATMDTYIYRNNLAVMLHTQPDSGSGGIYPAISGILNSGGGAAPLKPIYNHLYNDMNTLIANSGVNGGNTVADGLIYLADGVYKDYQNTNNYFDVTGGGQWQFNGFQSNFVSGGFSGGVLTVSSALGPGNFPNWNLITAGQLTWANHADAACTVGTQITGATGGAGTYNASGAGCSALTNGTAVIGYGLQGDGVVYAATLSGNKNMVTGASIDTITSGQLSRIAVPLP